MNRLNVVLIDDEPLCRQDLRDIFASFPEVNLLGEAGTLTEARSLVEKLRPNLIFLDLSLGRQNGFDFLRSILSPPLCIAVTADPNQGATAFEFDLVDYLVKPVEETRLRQALKRAVRRISIDANQDMPSFLAEISQQKVVIQAGEIQQIEGMGNYVILHSKKGKGIIRSSLKRILKQLDLKLWLQISGRHWVARKIILGWSRNTNTPLTLTLIGEAKVIVSRRLTPRVIASITPPPKT